MKRPLCEREEKCEERKPVMEDKKVKCEEENVNLSKKEIEDE